MARDDPRDALLLDFYFQNFRRCHNDDHAVTLIRARITALADQSYSSDAADSVPKVILSHLASAWTFVQLQWALVTPPSVETTCQWQELTSTE